MEAIILAGGLGSRLRTVVSGVPKPMARVAGRPFLELLLLSLARRKFTRVVLSVGYLADQITEHFGERFAGLEIAYVFEPSPLGTGGATRLALHACRSSHVFVLNGDTYVDFEPRQLEAVWAMRHSPLIVARAVEDTTRYGRLAVENGRVTAFQEKGAAGPGLISAGIYVLPRHALDAFPAASPFSIETDYLVPFAERAALYVVQCDGVFIDIGIPEDFARAQTLLADIQAA